MSINAITGSIAADNLVGTKTADLIYGADPFATTTTTPGFSLVTDGLGQSVAIAAAPGVAGRLYVLTRDGTIRAVDLATGTPAATTLLDIRASVDSTTGLAFHPDFARNGKFYVFAVNLAGNTEIREFRVDPADPERVLAGSERLILTVAQPNGEGHRGGTIVFAADGTLLVTVGDAGTNDAPDPFATGQNPSDLLGSVLRIDVDRDAFRDDPARNYAVPADNPFASGVGGAPEVWAYGFRNPFRAGVDRGTGDVFIGDVGQDAWEEVNLGASGANYGWSRYEGPAPFPPGSPPASTAGLTAPAYAYSHASGDGMSVTGGIVYRGPETGLQGRYIFGDFVTGRIFAIDDRDGDGVYQRIELANGGLAPGTLVGFAEDAEGNLFAVGLGFGARANGTLYRLTAGAPTGTVDVGDTLDGAGGDDRIFAGAGADRAVGGLGNDLIEGMEGNDTLLGSGGADSLVGGAGADSLDGGAGNDTLLGGDAADTLAGAIGADVLCGGAGADLLQGGSGADLFRYTSFADSRGVGGIDRIADFVSGSDRIDVSALVDGRFTWIGSADFTAGGAQARVVAFGSGYRLEVSSDGEGLDLAVQFLGRVIPIESDILL